MNAWGKRPRSLSSTWRVSESYGINGARHRADDEEDDDDDSIAFSSDKAVIVPLSSGNIYPHILLDDIG